MKLMIFVTCFLNIYRFMGHRVFKSSALPEIANCFLKCLYTVSVFHTFTKAWYCRHWQFVPLEDAKWNNTVTVTCICLISYEEACLFACIRTICVSHSVKCLPFTIFLLNCFTLNSFLWKYLYLFFMYLWIISMIFDEPKFLISW